MLVLSYKYNFLLTNIFLKKINFTEIIINEFFCSYVFLINYLFKKNEFVTLSKKNNKYINHIKKIKKTHEMDKNKKWNDCSLLKFYSELDVWIKERGALEDGGQNALY